MFGQMLRDAQVGKVSVVLAWRIDRFARSMRDFVFRRDEAVRLRESGVSWRAIARKLGVPQAAIRAALGRVQKV